MNLTGKSPTFRKQRSHSDPYRILILLGMLITSLFLLRAVQQDEIQSPFMPTPIPTRTAYSYSQEADSHFYAGNLNKAIEAYQQAVASDPGNAELWSELARVQAYSSVLLTTDQEKRERLQEALDSINKAVEANEFSSTAHAVRAFVLDWNSNPILSGDQQQTLLTEAEQSAVRALQLDNQNTLALVYYAEILVDQKKWLQASQYIDQALEQDSTLMDVHRVNAYVQETLGNYGAAINEYKTATQIMPNMTFLYINIGVNYRQLKQYEIALEYFAKAADINEQLGVEDPIPYIAIGKTYSQMGEFFIAGRNTRKALEINPYNPDVYGSLGMVYYKSRNYEGAIETLKCAVKGCNAEETCKVIKGDVCTAEEISESSPISGMPLSGSTVVYYYTYGSALAGMARPYNEYCEEAVQVLKEVRTQFSDEPVILQIVQTSEEICATFGYTSR